MNDELNKKADELASKIGCWFIPFAIVIGIISFITDFWYIFIGVLAIIILIYKNKK